MAQRFARPRLKLKIKIRYVVPVITALVLVYLIVIFFFNKPEKANATSNETLLSGSFIINMGVTPQTLNNGLRPYGMIYDLMVNYKVPIKWVIEPTKVRDGTDFTYAAANYKGGPFIVPVEYISTAVASRITYWTGTGVQGLYTTSNITVPVYATLTNFPKAVIDDVSGKSNIITSYFTNALIPAAGYEIGTPSTLTYCHDLWVNPHGDPNWTTHGYLYNLVTVTKSYIWCQCHSVSVLEGVKNPSSPFEQLNFLTTAGLKCYSNNQCGVSLETHGGNATSPFTYNYPTDPVMQFIGNMNGATTSGSERWYQPQSTGAWRATSKRLVSSSDGTTPGEGVLMVYGPAYGNASNGMVMYEGGHDLDGSGSMAERVAAQRAFFNFVLLAGIAKQIVFNTYTAPATLNSAAAGAVSVSVSAGSPAYTYQWSSDIGGTFSNPNSPTTTFTAPTTNVVLNGALSCTVTDACSRKNFKASLITIAASTLPIELKSFRGSSHKGTVLLKWITASEKDNAYFEIERSKNALDYVSIGKVPGVGNSTNDNFYQYVDNNPGVMDSYYRLKQVDTDGKFKVFNAILIKNKFEQSEFDKIEISPNPFHEKIGVNFYSSEESILEFTLLNYLGQNIRKESIKINPGINLAWVEDLGDIPSGTYFAVLSNDENKKAFKVIKD